MVGRRPQHASSKFACLVLDIGDPLPDRAYQGSPWTHRLTTRLGTLAHLTARVRTSHKLSEDKDGSLQCLQTVLTTHWCMAARHGLHNDTCRLINFHLRTRSIDLPYPGHILAGQSNQRWFVLLVFPVALHTLLGQQTVMVGSCLGPVIFRDRGKVAEFAELPT